MNTLLACGIVLVNVALVAYTAAFIGIMRKKKVSGWPITLLAAGVTLDISSTTLMIIGSSHSFMSSHGVLGYSALLLMLVECFLIWRVRSQQGAGAVLPRYLHIYARVAYMWWIVAYVAGAAIVAIR